MAAYNDSDEDESFVTLGFQLEVPDKDDPIRKPVSVQDLQVKDKQGRVRFHGAFTGGFSAGFFNSVGSKEGWTPSTFTSSRSQKADHSQRQKPEDFMDDEDVEEHGIAPRKLVTASTFTSEERKRRRQDEATMVTADSMLPGESALLDLIVPERLTIGVKLLRKMGWKDGQGVGPRLTRKQKRKQNAGQRIYGCELPPSSDSEDDLDDATLLGDITFAPRDSAHIFLSAKDNTRGLGYRGLDPQKALLSSRGRSLGLAPTSKAGRRGIQGQAFGVGALEEDDDDIYTVDDMSRYDMTMGGEEGDKNFGWTAPRARGSQQTPVGYVGQLLEGFKLASTKLIQKKDFPPPQLPRKYRPVHVFSKPTDTVDSTTTTVTAGTPVGVDYRQFLKPTADDDAPTNSSASSATAQSRDGKNKRYDSTARSMALGEQAFVGSIFDLIPERDKQKMAAARSGAGQWGDASSQDTSCLQADQQTTASASSCESCMDPGPSRKNEMSTSQEPAPSHHKQDSSQSQSTSQQGQNTGQSSTLPGQSSTLPGQSPSLPGQSPSLPGQSSSGATRAAENQGRSAAPLYQGGLFKPFINDAAKQERYDRYLALVKQGHRDPHSQIVSPGQTEWEADKEKEEFTRASRLFQPLSGMMAQRFTSGKQTDDNTSYMEVKGSEKAAKTDAEKAADMKMYGKLTREVQEWHPNRVVCKRFNVPDPYPGSTIVGLATVKRDKYSVFNFLNFDNPSKSELLPLEDSSSQRQNESSESTSQQEQPKPETENKVDKELNKAKSMKSIFSHLVDTEKGVQKTAKTVSFSLKSTKTHQPKEFKSIFSHLEETNEKKMTALKEAKVSDPEVKDKPPDMVEPMDTSEKAGSLEAGSQDGNKVGSKEGNKDAPAEKDSDSEKPMDLFRAIFRNTDSEEESSSSDEEVDGSTGTAQGSSGSTLMSSARVPDSSMPKGAEGADKGIPMITELGVDIKTEDGIQRKESLSESQHTLLVAVNDDRGLLPGNSRRIESIKDRLSPNEDSDESESYGPALPPPMAAVTTSTEPPSSITYVDLTAASSKKHKQRHKDKHKSKKDKKDKHKKSKHKKKQKKKERKKEKRKDSSDSSDTTDKDTEDDDTDALLLNKLKTLKPGQRLRAVDFM